MWLCSPAQCQLVPIRSDTLWVLEAWEEVLVGLGTIVCIFVQGVSKTTTSVVTEVVEQGVTGSVEPDVHGSTAIVGTLGT